jgi:5'-nucleotidase
MSRQHTPRILLVNDDGLDSKGLWAAAQTLKDLGEVTVVAPSRQQSGVGRSCPSISTGRIEERECAFDHSMWKGYAVDGTPAQVVQHALLEIVPEPPDLVVSGINIGENIGDNIGVSGTVGAALEAASLGIPGLAMSLEVQHLRQLHDPNDMDFSVAAQFARMFAEMMLGRKLPVDVDVLKVDVPHDAAVDTPWQITRLAARYHHFDAPLKPRSDWNQKAETLFRRLDASQQPGLPDDSDAYVLQVHRRVSVTPLTLDFSSRIDPKLFESLIRT